MKPTDKFFKTLEEKNEPNPDIEIRIESSGKQISIADDRFIIISKINALIEWAYGRSGFNKV